MKLFIEYQIPSDLLSYAGSESTSGLERVEAVKRHVSGKNGMIEERKLEELAEKKRQEEYAEAERKRQQAQQLLLVDRNVMVKKCKRSRDRDRGSPERDSDYEGYAKSAKSRSSYMEDQCDHPLILLLHQHILLLRRLILLHRQMMMTMNLTKFSMKVITNLQILQKFRYLSLLLALLRQRSLTSPSILSFLMNNLTSLIILMLSDPP